MSVYVIIYRVKKLIIAFALAALLTNSFAVKSAIAAPSEDIIRNGCDVAKSTLSQIEKFDVAVRLNRGYDYKEVLNLMFAMNARLAANQISAPELTAITAQFSKDFEDFHSHYDVYDDTILGTISSDCKGNPTKFYSKLEQSRVTRAVLRADLDKLNNAVSDYYGKFDSIIKGAGL